MRRLERGRQPAGDLGDALGAVQYGLGHGRTLRNGFTSTRAQAPFAK
jgi:hypothetical protein